MCIRYRYKLDHSDRVLPGNGELPCTDMTRMVKETGYNSAISVELFNEKQYGDTAENVIGQAYNAVQAHVAAANIEKEIDFHSNTCLLYTSELLSVERV